MIHPLQTLAALDPVKSPVDPLQQAGKLADLQNTQQTGVLQGQQIAAGQDQATARAQAQQTDAAFKKIFTMPGAIGLDGKISPQAIAAASQIDPQRTGSLLKATGQDPNTQSEIDRRANENTNADRTRQTAEDTLKHTVENDALMRQQAKENADREANKPIAVPEHSSLASPSGQVLLKGTPTPPPQHNIDPLSPEGQAATLALKTAESKLVKPPSDDPRLTNVDPKDYTEAKKEALKVENAYVAAQRASDDLGSFVSGARAGNKVAAQYSPVEAVLQINAGAGVKRINRQEIDQMAGAGSLFDHIAGWAGKQVAGQPIPKNILADMQSLSQLLAGNSKTQRSRGLQAVDKIYNSKFSDGANSGPGIVIDPAGVEHQVSDVEAAIKLHPGTRAK